MVSQFHDILPGSSIQAVEQGALRLLDHGLETVARVKAATFFAHSSGQPQAREDEIPVLVYNPCPYPVRQVIEVEFQLPDYHAPGTAFTHVNVFQDGKRLPSQVEKEASNLPIDWRKRVVFVARLQPGQMNRFDCRLQELARKPKPALTAKRGKITFQTRELQVVVNTRTGLLDQYRVNGVELVRKGACRPLVVVDDSDSWGTWHRSYRDVEGSFALMSRREGSRFSGIRGATIDSVRVVEDGTVRTVVEAVFSYRESFLCQQYRLPKVGTEIEIETRVFWNQKDRMLKLAIPTLGKCNRFVGQVAYGVGELPVDGSEVVAQKWVAVIDRTRDMALTCVDDGIYGADFSNETGLRLTLLRSPTYSCYPWNGKIHSDDDDRFLPRIDQGERVYRFWLKGGPATQRLNAVDREALARNEKPMALSFFPPGTGKKPKPLVILDDRVIQMTAMKQAEQGRDLIVRLFNPTGRKRSTRINSPLLERTWPVTLGPFEIKTVKISRRPRRIVETDLLEA
jgi:alpha-mannosidase